MDTLKFLHIDSWSKYLLFLILLMGAGFFASGVVTWIAANWDSYTATQKLYGTQALFGLSVVVGLLIYWRESHRAPAMALGSTVMIFVATVVIGALFALIGQIYQTGADVWQLFALWSLLQLPFLLALPNVAGYLLLMVTSNAALLLYTIPNFDVQAGASSLHKVELLNLAFLFIAEFGTKVLHDTKLRIASCVAVFGFLSSVFFVAVWSYSNEFSLWLVVGVAACVAYVYLKWRPDTVKFVIGVLFAVPSFILSILLKIWDSGWFSEYHVLAFGVFVVVSFIWSATIFIKHKGRAVTRDDGFPLALQIMQILGVSLGGLFIAIFVISIFGIESLFLVGILTIIIGLALSRSPGESYTQLHLFASALITVGNVLCIFAVTVTSDGYFGITEYDLLWRCFICFVVALFTYFLCPQRWIRVSTVPLLIWLLFDTLLPRLPGAPAWLMFNLTDDYFIMASYGWPGVIPWVLYLAMMVTFILGYFMARRGQDASEHLRSAFWGSVLYQIVAGISALFVWVIFFSGDIPSDSVVSGGVGDFIYRMSYGLYHSFAWANWYYYVIALMPALLCYLLGHQLSPGTRILSTLLVLVLSLCWIGSPRIILILGLLVVAYYLADSFLLLFGILSMTGLLGWMYYSLSQPLIYKASFLLIVGLALLLVVLFARKILFNSGEALPSAREKYFFWRPAMIVVGAVMVLFGANTTIQKYNWHLANGSSVYFQLAPVDPRSLMQGDYMALSYQIDRSFVSTVNKDRSMGRESSQAYASLNIDERNVATLCQLDYKMPTDFSSCNSPRFIRLKTNGFYDVMPVSSYFFAEGQGSYYAQAEYAEFVLLDDGKALLKRLLDKDLKPLEHPPKPSSIE